MDPVRIWTLFLVISIVTALDIRAVSRRQKRDGLLFRRLESLTIRIELIEVNLRQEKHKSDSLEEEISELKKRMAACEEKPEMRGGEGEFSGATLKAMVHFARKTFQTDLDMLTSGMIAEKQRARQTEKAVEFCKMTLQRHSPRLDTMEGNVSKLEDRLASVNTTVLAMNTSCSQCSAHAPRKRNEGSSGDGWTDWMNQDSETGAGDVEIITENPCGSSHPLKMQARIAGTTKVILSTDERLSVGPHLGLMCFGHQQTDNSCRDYAIRFEGPQMSEWFDTDDPDEGNDFEMKWKMTAPAWKDGNFVAWNINSELFGRVDRFLDVGPLVGLSCLNEHQIPGTSCRDYEVRYYC